MRAERSAWIVGGTSSLPSPFSACIATQLLDEERVALGRLDDRARASRVDSPSSPTSASSSSCQGLERDERRVRPRARPGRPRVEEVGPRRAEDEQRHVGREADDVLDQVEERRLRPVDVVEDDDQRPVAARAPRRACAAAQAVSSGEPAGGPTTDRAGEPVGDDDVPRRRRRPRRSGRGEPRRRPDGRSPPSGQYVIPSPYGRQRPTRTRARLRRVRGTRGRAATCRSRAAPTSVQSCGTRVRDRAVECARARRALARGRRTARRPGA